MEKVVDNDFSQLIKNKIILENCRLEMKKSTIQFNGEGNVIIFRGGIKSNQRRVLLEQSKITCFGNNNLILIYASSYSVKIIISAGHGCNLYIGENMSNTLPTYLVTNERANIVIGREALFARGVWLRASDMHMLYDIESKERINGNKDVFIGRHVWLGQDVICLKGSIVGSGSCVGLGSLVSNRASTETNAIYVGRPAKLIKTGIKWRNKGTIPVTEEELDNGEYQIWEDEKCIYNREEELSEIEKMKEKLSKLRDMEERITYLKSIDW